MRLPVLRITGSDPYSLGTQHGQAFAKEIRELSAIRNQLLAEALVGWSSEKIDRLLDDQITALETRWPSVLAELKGIADGSGVPLCDIVNLNGYTDLKDFGDSEPANTTEAGCSVFAAKGPLVNATGQTWDMHASAEPFMLLIELPDLPIPTRVLTLMGCVGLCGVNAAGVSVMINNLSCRETNRSGIVWNGLVRLLLEQRTASAACDVLRANLPTSGHQYLISDDNESISFETTGMRIEQYAAASVDEPELILHTNHYLTQLLEFEVTEKLSNTTRPRMAALETFRRENPIDQLTAATIDRAYLEDGSLCDCIFLRSPSPHGAATCGGIMVDYLTRSAFAYRGKYAAPDREAWRF